MPTDPIALLGRRAARLERREVLPGITELRTWTAAVRTLGSVSSCYLVDDALVDTGYAHVRESILAAVDEDLRWIALTHHHEDHMGNAGPLAARGGCPVYLRHAHLRATEGVVALAPYRRLYWGWPGEWPAEELPATVETSARTLRTIPAPGHSATQVALLDESTGAAFTGDLFIYTGAAAVLSHEDPWAIVASLRRLAAERPTRLLGGHGQDLADPTRALLRKADRVEAAATLSAELTTRGLPEEEILDAVFPGKRAQDRNFDRLTGGQFSYRNFVRNAVALA